MDLTSIDDQIGAYTLFSLKHEDANDENILARIHANASIASLELMKATLMDKADLNKYLIKRTVNAAPQFDSRTNTTFIEMANSPHRILKLMTSGDIDDARTSYVLDFVDVGKSIPIWKITIPSPDKILSTLLTARYLCKIKASKRIIVSLDYTTASGLHFAKLRQVLEHMPPEQTVMLVFIGNVASEHQMRHVYNISSTDFKQYDGKKLRDDLLAPVVGEKRKREAKDDE